MILKRALDKMQLGLDLFGKVSPQSRPGRLVLLWLDVIVINITFYWFLKSLLLSPLGYSSGSTAFALGILFSAALFVFYGLEPYEYQVSARGFWRQLGAFALFALLVAALASISVTEKGKDFSWLRVEMIKAPLWLKMFVPISPYYSLFIFAFISYLMWKSLADPKNRAIKIVSAAAAASLVWFIIDVFSKYGGFDFSVGNRFYEYDKSVYVYLVFFGGPAIIFTGLMWLRRFGFGFRIAPLMFYTSLVGLNYMGLLPVHSVFDLVPITTRPGHYTLDNVGVTRVFPPEGTEPDSTFAFLRDITVDDQRIIINHGPTCGFLSIDRKTGHSKSLSVYGLTRDFKYSPDQKYLWSINWENADFVVLEPETLNIHCSIDIFGFNLKTPYNFVIDGKRVFISNVTPPVVAEVFLNTDEDECSISAGRSINFQDIGYTNFTDGAFGLYHDPTENYLYALVGMLEGKNLVGLVRIDLDNFSFAGDIRLPAGTLITPIPDQKTVILPAYYRSESYEVSLEDLTLKRTIPTEPNIVSMVYDSKRKLLYGLARGSGRLVVIDYPTGKTIRRMPTGAKPEPLWLDEENDLLFFGSRLGLIQIDLDLFLAETLPPPALYPTAATVETR